MASAESRAGRFVTALRRRAGLVLVVLLVVLFRAGLPLVLKPVIESQASKALRGKVEIGALHLWLLLGGVQLEGVSVFPTESAEPILGWKRLYVRLGWSGLFRHTIHLREIELDTPFVEAERLKNGELNLQRLVAPAEAAPAEPAPESAKSTPWVIAIDRVTLGTGQIAFLDRTTTSTHPVSVEISKVGVDRFSLSRETYGEPAHIDVAGHVEGAPVHLQASLSFPESGLDLDATVEATGMPIHRAELYLPKTGWSSLKGLLDASLRYRLQTGSQDDLTGRVEVRELVVAVPKLDRPALAWRSLAIALDRVDLLHKSAAVKSVKLDGASIVVRPEDPVPLPVLPVRAAETPAAPAPAAKPGAANSEKPPAAAPVWQWGLETITLTDGRLALLGAGGGEDIGLRAEVTGISGKPQVVFPFEVSLTPSSGSIEAKGTASIDPLGFQVGLRWQQLSLPSLLAVAAHDLAQIVKKGASSGDLTIAAGMPGSAVSGGDPKAGKSPARPDGALRVRGRLGVSGLEVVGEDPKVFSARLASLDVEVTDIRVPKVLPAGAPPGPEPIRMKLGAIRIAQPILRVTRTPEGIVLPAALAGKPPPAAAPPPKAPPPKPRAAPTPAAPAPEIAVASVTLEKGDVVVVDKTMKPPPQLHFSAITMKARGISQPGPRVDDLAIRLTTPGGGPLSVTGHVSTDDTAIKVSADRMGLPTYNSYVSTLSGYSIADGHVSVESTIALKGSAYQTENRVTLQDLALAGAEGENLFAAQFGVPLSLALALMRDYQGNITLDVPVAGDASGTTLDLKTTLASVLRQAILNAVTSPLKVLGMVQLIGDKVQGFGPEPIPFVAGTANPAEGADPRVDALGSLLAGRPGLRVEIQGVIGAADVPRMREMDFLEGLRDVDAGKKPPRVEIKLWPWKRKKYHEYMEARESGGSPELDEDDKQDLEKLIAAVEIAPGADDPFRAARHSGGADRDRRDGARVERGGARGEDRARPGGERDADARGGGADPSADRPSALIASSLSRIYLIRRVIRLSSAPMTNSARTWSSPEGLSKVIPPPHLGLLALELRVGFELAAFFSSLPLLEKLPGGDGHPVLVLPGFLANDFSTKALRWFLRRRGYHVHGWRLGRNVGPSPELIDRLALRFHALRQTHGRPVTLIGWSLGGIYARELARAFPEDVRQLITLASPFRDPEATNITHLFRRTDAGRMPEYRGADLYERLRQSVPVPTTSIFSKTDGICAWQSCIDLEDETHQNVEVSSSHVGMGHNPAALYVIADRLAQPEGVWRPFTPHRWSWFGVRLLDSAAA